MSLDGAAVLRFGVPETARGRQGDAVIVEQLGVRRLHLDKLLVQRDGAVEIPAVHVGPRQMGHVLPFGRIDGERPGEIGVRLVRPVQPAEYRGEVVVDLGRFRAVLERGLIAFRRPFEAAELFAGIAEIVADFGDPIRSRATYFRHLEEFFVLRDSRAEIFGIQVKIAQPLDESGLFRRQGVGGLVSGNCLVPLALRQQNAGQVVVRLGHIGFQLRRAPEGDMRISPNQVVKEGQVVTRYPQEAVLPWSRAATRRSA